MAQPVQDKLGTEGETNTAEPQQRLHPAAPGQMQAETPLQAETMVPGGSVCRCLQGRAEETLVGNTAERRCPGD